MIKLFPKLKAAALLGCCGGFVAAAAIYSGGASLPCTVAVFAVCALLALLATQLRAVRIHQGILAWLYNKCEAKDFIEGYSILMKGGGKIRNNVRATMLAHLSNAYAALGDYEKALSLIDEIDTKGKSAYEILRAGNRGDIFWQAEDAAALKEEMKKLTELKADERKGDMAIYSLLEIKLAALESRATEAQLELARDTLRTAKNELFRLNLKYLLGLLYLQRGNTEFAGEYFKAVASCGKQLALVKKAEKQLEAM